MFGRRRDSCRRVAVNIGHQQDRFIAAPDHPCGPSKLTAIPKVSLLIKLYERNVITAVFRDLNFFQPRLLIVIIFAQFGIVDLTETKRSILNAAEKKNCSE